VGFSAVAYGSSCELIAESLPTWMSDMVTAILQRDSIAQVMLTLRRPGRATVSIDFSDGDGGGTDVSALPPPDGGVAPMDGGLPGADASVTARLELVVNIAPSAGVSPRFVEGIQVLDRDANVMVFATQNVGGDCGAGTAASIWRASLASASVPAAAELVANLTLIQNTRQSLFESADGTLFTGGGWCGPKPPYYSSDAGRVWQPATGEGHPPNSTFAFGELRGQVFAGTGYEPHNGEVYRWLGSGSWQRVLTIAPPRSIVNAFATYRGRLFVGSLIYGWGGAGCQSSTPVYVSDDGASFASTAGIAACDSVSSLRVVGDVLLAWTGGYGTEARSIYRWDPERSLWSRVAAYPLDRDGREVTEALGTSAFGLGRTAGGDSSDGLYESTDQGLTWRRLLDLKPPRVSSLFVHETTLYLGTEADSSGIAHIYRLARN
jgi:hypothetical protein